VYHGFVNDHMKANSFWGLVVLVVIIGAASVWVLMGETVLAPTVEEEQSQNADGENTGPLTPAQLEARVVVDVPISGATVPRTFSVSGKAPGPWYFEASFPIEVRSAAGTLLTTVVATAQAEWMTTDDVPFTASVVVQNYSGPATLVLHRDNASGLPEHDASVSIPIVIQ
jgi:hypothetical protein